MINGYNPSGWDFIPPGTLALTTRVLELARVFLSEAQKIQPQADWIVGFDWADSRRARIPKNSNNWVDLGAGFDLCVYERAGVPEAAIETKSDLEFAIRIPRHIWEKAARRSIDLDGSARPNIILL